MIDHSKTTRREFIQVISLVGGGLAVGFTLEGSQADSKSIAAANGSELAEAKANFAPNAWLNIYADGRMVFILDRVEMGQGSMTAHAALLAEELEVDPRQLEVKFAEASRIYDNPEFGFQVTGGSTGIKSAWKPLREAGAVAREMLIAAAAHNWSVEPGTCHAKGGIVFHTETARQASYASLAIAAALLPPPKPQLKSHADFKVIGKPMVRLDAHSKVNGTAVFGIDVVIKDMVCAGVIRPPEASATLKNFDASQAKVIPGVIGVYGIPSGVAVVAEKYWQVKKAIALVTVTWTPGALQGVSSPELRVLHAKLAEGDAKSARSEGRLEEGIKDAIKVLDAVYDIPFAAHATMEPQNCTAWVRDDSCEVWAPTQSSMLAQEVAAKVAGMSADKVKIHQTFLGGGFGRRLIQDYVAEAVHIAKLIKKPVKVIWTREDDFKHDFYRPAAYHKLRAGVDKNGKVSFWTHRIVGQGLLSQIAPDFIVGMAPAFLPSAMKRFLGNSVASLYKGLMIDDLAVEGAASNPYDFPNMEVDYVFHESGIPIGSWRSVGHSGNGFVVEGFVDELAHLAGADPFEFRRQLLTRMPRNKVVLELAASKAGWGRKLQPGHGLGIAQHHSFNSFVAHVVEVAITAGQMKIIKIWSAIDCGIAVNPDIVRAQVEGSIVYGLSAALKGNITFKNGAVEQSNFHDHDVFRLTDMPPVEVHIVPSNEPPTGVGEPGLPPIAPALANAIFAASGKRFQKMPLPLSELI